MRHDFCVIDRHLSGEAIPLKVALNGSPNDDGFPRKSPPRRLIPKKTTS
jgi:hypothetical protein